MTSVSPQAAAFYPPYDDAEHAAFGFTSNQSALPDGNNHHGNNILTWPFKNFRDNDIKYILK